MARFFILTYGEYDSQSSAQAWEVLFPYQRNGYPSRKEAEAALKGRRSPENSEHVIAEVA